MFVGQVFLHKKYTYLLLKIVKEVLNRTSQNNLCALKRQKDGKATFPHSVISLLVQVMVK